ncbi:hypothetical protein HC766_01315 [Candidatus Gracilibacteria bacterium]|nr:hypothetical protein [Thermales bacterium]NJL96817.1 hypothetical protein [Candidatus Gracilibacteria bacterium]NJS41013.1 hypothetical protein [Candidatus Gracilibacteria bacterium]
MIKKIFLIVLATASLSTLVFPLSAVAGSSYENRIRYRNCRGSGYSPAQCSQYDTTSLGRNGDYSENRSSTYRRSTKNRSYPKRHEENFGKRLVREFKEDFIYYLNEPRYNDRYYDRRPTTRDCIRVDGRIYCEQ